MTLAVVDKGGQCLSGRVLDLGLRGCGSSPHEALCCVLEQDTLYSA